MSGWTVKTGADMQTGVEVIPIIAEVKKTVR